MGAFHNQEELVRVLSALWEAIFATPEIVRSVSGSRLIAKFRYTDFPTALMIDISGETPRYFWADPDNRDFDVEMILSSETAHLFWMEQLNVPLALATRKIVAKGSVQKALKLVPALKPAFVLYPRILRELGRADLLPAAPQRKARRRLGWFFGKRRGTVQPERIPEFPLEFAGHGTPASGPGRAGGRKDVGPVDLLTAMLTIRYFEQHLAEAFQAGRLPTEAIHLSIGQEAVAAGVCMQLRDSDYLNTTHRGHGHIIAKGADVQRMMAEIYGKAEGLCKGKGGSMHVTDGRIGVLGANGIVGAGYLLALGAGFSIKHYRKSDDISVVIAGDGSVNQGMFHEAMNMIAVFNLPVLVVVENNRYGEFTAIERHSAVTEVFRRAEAYGVASHRFDGNDARTVFAEVGRIIDGMRADGRPRLVELMTYRWHGHMEGDQQQYRGPEEKALHAKADPVRRLEQELVGGGMSPEELEGLRGTVRETIAAAVRFAEQAPEPQPGELSRDIYSPEDRALFSGSFQVPDDAAEFSVSQAINMALAQEMDRDERVFLWGEDVTLGGYFNVTEGLVDRFGTGRIIDTPISENAFVGGAVGAAMTGMRPVAEILFADFLTCCMDPIVNQAAKLRYMTGGQVSVPLVIRTPLGSGIGMAAQHSQSMEKFFCGIPGLMVVAPSDAFTAKGLLASAIRSDNPVLFFEHKLLYAESGKAPAGEYTLPIGKARTVRPGRDVTIVTYLLGVGIAKSVAGILEREGVEAEIIDLVTLYPLDTESILGSVARTGRLAVLEEAHFSNSIGSEVISRVALAGFSLLKTAPVKISAPDCPIPYAKNLENAMLPSAERAAATIRGML
ncbi:MAG: pyruvate dehydrogenase complex E1 component subunit beta [Thermodesulfobacteriota bacterium]